MSKPRKLLNDWDAPYIQSLKNRIDSQSKTTLAHWCLEYATEWILPLYERRIPDDPRPRKAIEAAHAWLAGTVKLPQAKQAILACHAAARAAEGDAVAQAAARAIGQCASTIHSARHCIGLAMYGALAVAYDRTDPGTPWDRIEAEAAHACAHMEAALAAVSVTGEPHPEHIDWKRPHPARTGHAREGNGGSDA